MTVRVGINGFGRTGRTAFRSWWESWTREGKDDVEIVAINRGPAEVRAHLLSYDSDYGRFPAEIEVSGDELNINGHKVRVFNGDNPESIPWNQVEVDVVIESTGKFRTAAEADGHLQNGAKKVIISAPAKGVDWTVIMGANHQEYSPDAHNVISAGSCTTNCIVLAVKVLNDAFGVDSGLMSTIHAYTGDQNLVDNSHKDLRRARAAALNIVPTSSGAASAIGEIIPELKGKIDGFAYRVPTPTVSVVDLVTTLRDSPSANEINEAFEEAATGDLSGLLYYEPKELVSSDFKKHPGSAIHDAQSTMAVGEGKLAKTVTWYDNEWGYSCRLIDVARMLAREGL